MFAASEEELADCYGNRILKVPFRTCMKYSHVVGTCKQQLAMIACVVLLSRFEHKVITEKRV